ncbi:hypothetical protein [Sandaracinus amylolyticus]|uniref:hypothetical protein n=1 Tax=Sandaracinus amylolyticus TaxID=927083 RepID=UPI001F34244F|nr:hypothetical protein [Sandaracinus amylolyticus]
MDELDAALGRALRLLQREEALLRWAARTTGRSERDTLLETVERWISEPFEARVIEIAARDVVGPGARRYDHTNELGRRMMDLERAALGPAIAAARRASTDARVHDHAEAHAGAPEVDAWLRAVPSAMPAERRRALLRRHPRNVIAKVGASELVWLATYDHHVLIVDGRFSYPSIRPGVEASAGHRRDDRASVALRDAPPLSGPRYVLLRLDQAPHRPRIVDLADGAIAAPERVADGVDRTLLRIDDDGVIMRRDARDVHIAWAELEWEPTRSMT